jgi:ubiquinone/menaquinone biosynthesis C-methylase UbiE
MSAETKVHHPLFARLFEKLVPVLDTKGGADHRQELLGGLSGRVVEVGAGTGANFRHYPATVTEVVAVEPEAYLRARAEEAARAAPVPVTVVDATADRLPFEAGSFDGGVASLVLCSVADQAAALGELFRVIRPGGELRFYEHVRSERPRLARFQQAADRVWPLLAGGCHTSRETSRAIEAAGFDVERHRAFDFKPCATSALVAPHILGVARRP